MSARPVPPLFVALDVPEPEEALSLARRLAPLGVRFKVGPYLFLHGGTEFVRELTALGNEVFLDVKLHDIPAVVAGGVRSAARLGVHWLTLHAAGGREMLRQAVEAARESGRPRLLAVTLLTSLGAEDLSEIGIARDPEQQVCALARLAVESGVDGVVSSALEVSRLREALGAGPVLVCPGVRPEGADPGDQKRVATPVQALRAGADLLVVGRPVTRADDPERAVKDLLDSLR